MNDTEIVKLYLERSGCAIEETEHKYSGYLYSVAYRILSDDEDSRECVNDTYLSAWNSIPPHEPTMLSTFLGKIIRRIAIDRYRQKTAQKRGGGEMAQVANCTEIVGTLDSTNPLEVDFFLDRPFVFYITNDAGMPKFIGVVNNP